MITRERLEETIRGVIREFKETRRIPEPAADELAATLDARMRELFEQEGTFSYQQVEESVAYVDRLRDEAESKSAAQFLQELRAWQQAHSL